MGGEIRDENAGVKGESSRWDHLRLLLALLGGLGLRLGTWPQVFAGGRVWIDGPDGYYHLRRAWLTLQQWPRTPQTDMLIGVPDGGPISWPPVFDLLLATLALPWRGGSVTAIETVGAFLPPLIGVLEILALYWLVKRLFGSRAAGWAALFAAILPGVVRYSLLGALDHDPLVETVAMVALLGLAGAATTGRARWGDGGWVALGLTLLVLTWAGAIVHIGLLVALVTAQDWRAVARRAPPVTAPALGAGSLVAAIATVPFVCTSVWTERFGATFIGLSWLHTAALLGAATVGFGIAAWSDRRARYLAPLGLVALGLVVLLGIAGPAFIAGLTFFGRGEPFLQGVMESRPLLSLFGTFDVSAPLIRLSLLPLLVPALLALSVKRSRSGQPLVFLCVWLGYTLATALVQSRFSHAAALPVAALGGVLVSWLWTRGASRWRASLTALIAALVVVPSLPAYVTIPGLESFRFYGRAPKIVSTGFFAASDYLRDVAGASRSWQDHQTASDSSVMAPWSAGHWLIWSGRQGTVVTPLGPQGQPAFVDGIRFYLTADEDEARRLIDKHRVRYVALMAQIPALGAYVELADVDPGTVFVVDDGSGPWPLDAGKYLATIAARLTWAGPGELELFGRRLGALEEYVEVFRSSWTRPNPFAGALPGAPSEVPLVRLYEVRPGRSPSDESGARQTVEYPADALPAESKE